MPLSVAGYGDIHAVNIREMIFIMIYVSFDMVIGAYLIGNMTALIVKGSKTEKFRDKMTDLIKYMNRNRLGRDIRNQIKGHVRLQYESSYTEAAVLQDIPISIRARVSRKRGIFEPQVLRVSNYIYIFHLFWKKKLLFFDLLIAKLSRNFTLSYQSYFRILIVYWSFFVLVSLFYIYPRPYIILVAICSCYVLVNWLVWLGQQLHLLCTHHVLSVTGTFERAILLYLPICIWSWCFLCVSKKLRNKFSNFGKHQNLLSLSFAHIVHMPWAKSKTKKHYG